MGTWFRKKAESLSSWLDDKALLRQQIGSASLTDIHANLDILDTGAATSSLLVSYVCADSVQAPLSLAFQSIDAVAQYSSAHLADWTFITPETVAAAKDLAARYYFAIAEAGELWQPVHVSSDAEGGISFEWWNEDRTLTLFTHPDQSTSYLFAWGLNIWTEMETGENPDDSLLLSLWLRLNEGE